MVQNGKQNFYFRQLFTSLTCYSTQCTCIQRPQSKVYVYQYSQFIIYFFIIENIKSKEEYQLQNQHWINSTKQLIQQHSLYRKQVVFEFITQKIKLYYIKTQNPNICLLAILSKFQYYQNQLFDCIQDPKKNKISQKSVYQQLY
ncbi:hypothetical protein TTHERM_001169394 (macronuclear) [Tetrahymena thermophila SB210]|uniref:Uncharacterized protein n=1 Tax=Tetrahymena thermophila (strain SB210) TaxID=312017 RepID=W7XCA6_TETTS|nr:hypothetical protein TTHERM_001169394 [Tetrahymena thermophila SB210]EWS74178.1 hypothetical protein TTHERM_001169394 [Tetrahymena thermophila SB210]|eukprot:XP_012653285.1 hypothetical protein TTHERM_001169394 [Tetrahymena thermophila SB210]